MVRETVEQFRRYAALHGFTVSTEISAVLPPVAFDALSVEQAVMNLLDNAAKYWAIQPASPCGCISQKAA